MVFSCSILFARFCGQQPFCGHLRYFHGQYYSFRTNSKGDTDGLKLGVLECFHFIENNFFKRLLLEFFQKIDLAFSALFSQKSKLSHNRDAIQSENRGAPPQRDPRTEKLPQGVVNLPLNLPKTRVKCRARKRFLATCTLPTHNMAGIGRSIKTSMANDSAMERFTFAFEFRDSAFHPT